MNFAQQFHLPFYSWRRTSQPPKDNRSKNDGNPLRKVFNMQFLQGESPESVREVDYLCEGQLSVLITAINDTVWTGYCFVDTYYQNENQKRPAKYYCKGDSDEDGLQTDPFTNGERDSSIPILDPSHYFLIVLHSQLQVFKHEWTNTVHELGIRVQNYVFIYI